MMRPTRMAAVGPTQCTGWTRMKRACTPPSANMLSLREMKSTFPSNIVLVGAFSGRASAHVSPLMLYCTCSVRESARRSGGWCGAARWLPWRIFPRGNKTSSSGTLKRPQRGTYSVLCDPLHLVTPPCSRDAQDLLHRLQIQPDPWRLVDDVRIPPLRASKCSG